MGSMDIGVDGQRDGQWDNGTVGRMDIGVDGQRDGQWDNGMVGQWIGWAAGNAFFYDRTCSICVQTIVRRTIFKFLSLLQFFFASSAYLTEM